ncbi:hypothetical protein [Opitutus sp. ER46]|uniref:hypothetical protein n=1 Tax=Opitutus sp. ER46 TaxID=2161864 RepID=UPI000D2FD25A|nr:hypothetical protein [Opitutus sp. ER46]PTX92458.1 hypothetical protein DB354_14075 [Opitutus sp. ER46]
MAQRTPSRTSDDLRRLHFINSLFAHATGHDLYLAEQIKSAITFSLAELEAQTTAHPELAQKYDAAFNAAAAELLTKVFATHPRHGFYHWDASLTLASATPLFTRAEVMAGLKRLAPFRESTLLITNLRHALLPPNRRATPRRRREYEEALAFIRDLAAARTARSANLQLLFL